MSGVLKAGERFAGRYLVENLVDEGGMAEIYRARDQKLNHLVAIKVLYPYFSDNEVIRKRFVEEGRIQQFLEHPNIVYVNEVIDEPLAIVMEYVDGPTLDDYLAEQGQIPEDEILDIIIPIMSALGLAHSKGIIHRDLKPSNILLHRQRRGFQPKVMDFGVAKVKDAKHDLTATGTTVGTLHYMSPEQIVGSKNIDGRADIYSLGVTLYKLVTGEVPFNAPTEFALMMAQVEAPPLEPSKLRKGLSPELEHVILKAMEKKPVDRFQSVRQFTTALLEMKRDGSANERTVRDTITETISQELIDFALAADSVAQDRTAEMNLRVMRDEILDEIQGASEPTVEMESRFRSPSRDSVVSTGAVTAEQPAAAGDSTMELSSQEIINLSEIDATSEDYPRADDSNAATAVMNRRISRSGERIVVEDEAGIGPTQPQPAVSGPGPGTGNLVSESIDTASLSQRVRLDSGRVVVLDEEANSRDMTAPKVSQEAYDSVLGDNPRPNLPRPSGPKVVLGYNPADTQEQTFEKPNYRTKLPEFETARSNDHNGAPQLPRVRTPPSQVSSSQDGPLSVPTAAPGQSASSSSIIERIDILASSAIQTAADNNLPPAVVVVAVFAVFLFLGCIFLGAYLLFS